MPCLITSAFFRKCCTRLRGDRIKFLDIGWRTMGIIIIVNNPRSNKLYVRKKRFRNQLENLENGNNFLYCAIRSAKPLDNGLFFIYRLIKFHNFHMIAANTPKTEYCRANNGRKSERERDAVVCLAFIVNPVHMCGIGWLYMRLYIPTPRAEMERESCTWLCPLREKAFFYTEEKWTHRHEFPDNKFPWISYKGPEQTRASR